MAFRADRCAHACACAAKTRAAPRRGRPRFTSATRTASPSSCKRPPTAEAPVFWERSARRRSPPGKPPLVTREMNHVTLAVSDPKRSLEFYQRVFGLPVVATQGAIPIMRVGRGPGFIALNAAGHGEPEHPPRLRDDRELRSRPDDADARGVGRQEGRRGRRGTADGAHPHARSGSGRREGRHTRALLHGSRRHHHPAAGRQGTAAAPAASAKCVRPRSVRL